jgi:bis(5'-nucleosyl)-tetraphosphatase (symmetrical)
MATYAIGDVQGCFDELEHLLRECRFEASRDRLWFVGDLVNRGPKSLEVLRFVRDLGDCAVAVLGNHDLHLVALHEGFSRLRPDDTMDEIRKASDTNALLDWLRARPMMHVAGGWAMVHAGLLPQWSIEKACALGKEVEQALRGPRYRDFLQNMYGSKPDEWSEELAGWDRLRVIVNAMTRLRYCTPQGRMDFHEKATTAPPGHVPWFELRQDAHAIVCGHWSAMGLKCTDKLAALDSGCVWGGRLTALRLEDRALYQVPCAGYRPIG